MLSKIDWVIEPTSVKKGFMLKIALFEMAIFLLRIVALHNLGHICDCLMSFWIFLGYLYLAKKIFHVLQFVVQMYYVRG